MGNKRKHLKLNAGNYYKLCTYKIIHIVLHRSHRHTTRSRRRPPPPHSSSSSIAIIVGPM